MSKRNKRRASELSRIRGTYHLSLAGVETDEVRSLILRRRLQLLIHSYIYYDMNDNLVSDETWSRWAQELVKLQKNYPQVAKRVDYHEAFEGFDGSTGFDLPYRNPEISSKARWLMKYFGGSNVRITGHKIDRAGHRADVIRIVFPE